MKHHTPLLRQFALLAALFLLPLLAVGQQSFQKDSLAVIRAKWRVDSLQDGMIYKTVRFANKELFNSNQVLSVIEIPKKSSYRLAFSYEPKRTITSRHAAKHKAVAAINGSFFDMQEHNPICFLRIDGKRLGINEPGTDPVNRKYYQTGTIVIVNGTPIILRTQPSRKWEDLIPYTDVMTAGPLLIYHGEQQPMRNDRTFVTNRHNRTALGIKDDGTIVLFTVDGRFKESAGMSLPELIKTLSWLGCRDAINLDGGGSTTMYLNGQVKNYPSDNGRFDHSGERGVSNCILVIKR